MTQATTQRQFPCRQCGANLVFAPGQSALKCPYCQTENAIEASARPVEEMDYLATLRGLRSASDLADALTVKCDACGAETTLEANVTASACAFCGSAIVAQAASTRHIKPASLLPFHITRDQAMSSFRSWVDSLWFAPNDLRKYAEAGGIRGVYIPYWTYDCDAWTRYTGERGEDYWDTEHYTTTENGKTVHKTRQVRKTRWYPASGTVANSFDDVLILASTSLPRKHTEALEPWDLQNLVPYGDEYLAGFVAESYQIDLEKGFDLAREWMDSPIRESVCRDIGGDHQRIHSMDTRYDHITYKHLLLPLWLSAYRYREKAYRFLVNARTGEVCGERPWSAWKIALLVLAILIVIGVIALIASQR